MHLFDLISPAPATLFSVSVPTVTGRKEIPQIGFLCVAELEVRVALPKCNFIEMREVSMRGQ